MKTEEFDALIESLAKYWTAANYEAVVNRFADELYYADPLNYRFHDKESLLKFFEDDGGQPQHCRFFNVVFDESKQLGAAEYTYQGSFVYYGTVWVRIENDKIVSWREYQHRSEKPREEFWDGSEKYTTAY